MVLLARAAHHLLDKHSWGYSQLTVPTQKLCSSKGRHDVGDGLGRDGVRAREEEKEAEKHDEAVELH
jgi:hypothetical protein